MGRDAASTAGEGKTGDAAGTNGGASADNFVGVAGTEEDGEGAAETPVVVARRGFRTTRRASATKSAKRAAIRGAGAAIVVAVVSIGGAEEAGTPAATTAAQVVAVVVEVVAIFHFKQTLSNESKKQALPN